jgi:lysozyme
MFIIDLLKRQEGFSATVYICTGGKKSIGYGYNLEANPLNLSSRELADFARHGISKEQAENLLIKQVIFLEHGVSGKLPWWSKLTANRQSVLLSMAYQIGVSGLLGFKKTLAYIKQGNYTQASKEMMNSTWAKQTPKRAADMAYVMATGKALSQ